MHATKWMSLQSILLRCSQVPSVGCYGRTGVQEESWVSVCKHESWKQAEGGNVDRLRMEFEGRAESMADVSDEGGCENTELLAIEMRRGDVW